MATNDELQNTGAEDAGAGVRGDDVDRTHARDDRTSIERYSQGSLEGWVDTPYVKVLFSKYYAQASKICAVDLGDVLMKRDNRIRALYSALEMKVLNITRLRQAGAQGQNPRGLRRELSAVDNFRISLFEAIDEKGDMIESWRFRVLALIDKYNERIACYIDEVIANKAAVVDCPKLDETDLPGLFAEELALVERQREQYKARADQLVARLNQPIGGAAGI